MITETTAVVELAMPSAARLIQYYSTERKSVSVRVVSAIIDRERTPVAVRGISRDPQQSAWGAPLGESRPLATLHPALRPSQLGPQNSVVPHFGNI